jgi:hypothetical protein
VLDQLFEKHGRADIVDRSVSLDRVHRLANTDLGSEMNDAVDPFQSRCHLLAGANIATHQLDFGIKGGRIEAVSVNLFDQAVEHANLVAAIEELGGNRPADETGAAGDQDVLHSLRPNGRRTDP